VKANFHSGKLSVDWNGQENFSLSCELWVGTNDFNTKKNWLVRSNPRGIIFLSFIDNIFTQQQNSGF
jgi:hypothetical protein